MAASHPDVKDYIGSHLGSAYPGAAFAYGTSKVSRIEVCGHLDVSGTRPVLQHSLYDLASLTKVIATTSIAQNLVDDLDVPMMTLIGPPIDPRVTIRHLLTHTSGLPAHREFWKRDTSLWHSVLRELIIHEPGSQVEYSCVGFLMLQMALGALASGDHDPRKAKELFEIELGTMNRRLLTRFSYNPSQREQLECAETEDGLRGVVHDENARYAGGVAANAGLFGSIGDVAAFCQDQLARKNDLQDWTTAQPGCGTRGLGWDTRAESGSSGGNLISRRSFGHTGFTGTSLWIDPEHDFFAALLTNRVAYGRDNMALAKIRPEFVNLGFQAITSI